MNTPILLVWIHNTYTACKYIPYVYSIEYLYNVCTILCIYTTCIQYTILCTYGVDALQSWPDSTYANANCPLYTSLLPVANDDQRYTSLLLLPLPPLLPLLLASSTIFGATATTLLETVTWPINNTNALSRNTSLNVTINLPSLVYASTSIMGTTAFLPSTWLMAEVRPSVMWYTSPYCILYSVLPANLCIIHIVIWVYNNTV